MTTTATKNRAAFIRIFVLLAVVCAGSWCWEFSHNNPSQPVMGEVLQVMRVGSSGTGDNREFTIRYQVRGEHYQLVTRRGLIDSLFAFRDLVTGDQVPLKVATDEPARAALDSLTARYPITAALLALTALVMVSALLVWRRRRD